jgi:menaquinone-dependent protoporphyrinogen oxidase
MTNFLIVYSSTDGQTLKICHELQTIIEQQHHQVVLIPVDQADRINVSNFDKIVIGASIRYGHHKPQDSRIYRAKQTFIGQQTQRIFFS